MHLRAENNWTRKHNGVGGRKSRSPMSPEAQRQKRKDVKWGRKKMTKGKKQGTGISFVDRARAQQSCTAVYPDRLSSTENHEL